MRTKSAALLCLILAASARAADADGYERVSLVKHADFEISVLYRPTATPADREFLGFAIENKTAGPLLIPNVQYHVEDVTRTDRATSRPVLLDPPEAGKELVVGVNYDVLYPKGTDRNAPLRPLPPGELRRFDNSSESALRNLGIPPADSAGLAINARVRVSVFYHDQTISTPKDGVPIRFDWLPLTPGESERLTDELRELLRRKPQREEWERVRRLLDAPGIGGAVSADELIAVLDARNPADQPILKAIDRYHPNDPKLVDLALALTERRDYPAMSVVSQSSSLHDARLVEPLRAWAVADVKGWGPYVALRLLSKQLDLAPDRAALVAELGRVFLRRSPHVMTKSFAGENAGPWEEEMRQLAMTRDPALVPTLLPYLDRRDVVIDAKRIQAMNNGVSTRACDIAQNTILDLFGRDGERFKLGFGWDARRILDPTTEYARRDALIAKLKAELTAKP